MTHTEKVALAMAWYDSGLEDRAAFQKLMESLFVQPEQEPVQKPVAVVSSCTGVGDKGVRVKWLGGFPQIGDRLYFHPPQRKPLTKEEIEPIAIDVLGYGALLKQDMELFTEAVRAVEAAHGIKENT